MIILMSDDLTNFEILAMSVLWNGTNLEEGDILCYGQHGEVLTNSLWLIKVGTHVR